MTTSGMKICLNQNNNNFSISDNENELSFVFSDHLNKYLVIFNSKVMASSKTINWPFIKFNQLKEKYNL